jgi:hypothetical protein
MCGKMRGMVGLEKKKPLDKQNKKKTAYKIF